MLVRASAAVSLDGYIDDNSSLRLILSSPEDWEQVYRLRAASDAVLVGAGTLRRDNPALVTREEALRLERLGRGQGPDPVKVTLSRNGLINPNARFFTEGTGEKIVFLGAEASPEAEAALRPHATVIRYPQKDIPPRELLRQLEARGLKSLFLEGGSRVLTDFLAENAVDYLRLALAPFFVGETSAPRFVNEARFPFDQYHRLNLRSVNQAGDMAVMEYALRASAEDYARLNEAIALAEKSPASASAYSVGALIVTPDGHRFTGYSRETAPGNHAEEEAIAKAQQQGCSLAGATLYSSMEPCSTRSSKTASCTQLIIEQRFARVVMAAYEPDRFARCEGSRLLQEAGIDVVVVDELAAAALVPNQHLLS